MSAALPTAVEKSFSMNLMFDGPQTPGPLCVPVIQPLAASTTVELVACGTSSAIPLKRWVLRTRPLRGQSRYYPNFLGHAPKPKIASRFSSTSILLN